VDGRAFRGWSGAQGWPAGEGRERSRAGRRARARMKRRAPRPARVRPRRARRASRSPSSARASTTCASPSCRSPERARRSDGVSGSGKSTLLDEVIYRNWLRQQGRAVEAVGRVEQIGGWKPITEMHLIGQDLLGRSSRSNPLSFVKAYAEIRKLLAGTLLARRGGSRPGPSRQHRGWPLRELPGHGDPDPRDVLSPDVEVVCETCQGRRFEPKVLEVTWRGRNIAAILDLTVDEATEFFAGEAGIVQRLSPLREVGLGYILLGQSTTTLSGGEAQRLKIAALLAEGMSEERQLFLFDEPTTGCMRGM